MFVREMSDQLERKLFIRFWNKLGRIKCHELPGSSSKCLPHSPTISSVNIPSWLRGASRPFWGRDRGVLWFI